MNKCVIISLILLFVGQLLAWFQQFAQVKWLWFKENIWFTAIIMAIPTSYAFIYGAKYGYIGFEETWVIRLVQFSLGIIVMASLSYFLLGEPLNFKNTMCLILALGIILIQIFVK